MRPQDRLLHDEPFGEVDVAQGSELRVAAFDELREPRRSEACGDGGTRRWPELREVAGQRPALHIVRAAHVDHEGRARRVVDEVVADRLWFPGLAVGAEPSQPGA